METKGKRGRGGGDLRPQAEAFLPGLAGQDWELSPVQRHGSDPVVRGTRWDAARGRVRVPALTAAVLVRPR